ncbi:MAG TPA: hypothetical protein VK747_08195 [Blastocatellia bacterium]|nr:hypothetical protein [Blastocatellia bacterium]
MNDWISRRSYVRSLLAAIGAGSLFVKGANADQPAMQNALTHLQQARKLLERADTDKGGHRKKALEHTNQAIDEVQLGIRYDRAH